MVKQEILFVHDPHRIRLATINLAVRRLVQPWTLLILVVLLLLFLFGLFAPYIWMLILPIAASVVIFLRVLSYVLTSPHHFCGIEIRLSISEDGLHFSAPDRESTIGWSAFREVYLLNRMWALFFKNSEAVTYIPTDQIDSKIQEFMFTKLREANVKIYGDGA